MHQQNLAGLREPLGIVAIGVVLRLQMRVLELDLAERSLHEESGDALGGNPFQVPKGMPDSPALERHKTNIFEREFRRGEETRHAVLRVSEVACVPVAMTIEPALDVQPVALG